MPIDAWLPWAFVGAMVFLVGLSKSGFGGGVALLAVPTTAIALGYTPRGSGAALGLLLPLLVLGDTIAVWQYRDLFSVRIVKRLAAGSLLGVVVGGAMLWWFHRQKGSVEAIMRVQIGVESVGLISLHWWRQWRGVPQRTWPEPWRGRVTGLAAAVSSTLAHAAGPIVVTYLMPLKLDRREFVGTTAIYFFAVNGAKLPAYWLAGQFERADPAFSLRFVPLVVVGAIVGVWLNKRMSDRLFRTVVYGLTFALGWYLLVDGVVKLIASQGGD